MALKLSVGLSKKVGQPDYGSLGASCNVEVELDASLLHDDPARFQTHVHEAFTACQRAVDEELHRLQSGGAPNRDRVDNRHATRPPARGSGQPNRRPQRPITPAQLNALEAIAQRRGIDIDGYAANEFGVASCDQLSLNQASRLIDTLRATAIAS